MKTKSVKQCIQFYYLWKKVLPDEHKRLRVLRRKREQLYNLRSRQQTDQQKSEGRVATVAVTVSASEVVVKVEPEAEAEAEVEETDSESSISGTDQTTVGILQNLLLTSVEDIGYDFVPRLRCFYELLKILHKMWIESDSSLDICSKSS